MSPLERTHIGTTGFGVALLMALSVGVCLVMITVV